MVERRTPERGVGGSKPTTAVFVSLSKTLYSPKVLVIPGTGISVPTLLKNC